MAEGMEALFTKDEAGYESQGATLPVVGFSHMYLKTIMYDGCTVQGTQTTTPDIGAPPVAEKNLYGKVPSKLWHFFRLAIFETRETCFDQCNLETLVRDRGLSEVTKAASAVWSLDSALIANKNYQ